MYNAKEMNAIAQTARTREEIRRKCIAQNYFADVYPAIEEAATQGHFSIVLTVPGDTRNAIKEIFSIFRKFGYKVKDVDEKLFLTVFRVLW